MDDKDNASARTPSETYKTPASSEDYAVHFTDMPDGSIEELIKTFEACARKTEEGAEFWMARDLQKLLNYDAWRNFKLVIDKATTACFESGNAPEDHFVDADKMIEVGKGGQRKVSDIMLSRYACYLVAQNGDARKRPVAFAQTYFAIQTRKQELAEKEQASAQLSEDEKRVLLRQQIKEHNKHLASTAKEAGVKTSQDFANFQSHGYQGLYRKTAAEIRIHKGLSRNSNILDRMGSTKQAANFFQVTPTEEKLRNEGARGKSEANRTHFEVGRQVREAMLNISGIAPEDLPIADNIKQAEKRLYGSLEPAVIELHQELWKYVLLIMVQRPDMEISIPELIAELPSYIYMPEAGAPETAGTFTGRVMALHAGKDEPDSFVRQGYAEALTQGFRATEKGKAFILDYFKDRM